MPYARRYGRKRAAGGMRRRKVVRRGAVAVARKALAAVRTIARKEEVKFIETEAINMDLGAAVAFPTSNFGAIGNGGAIYCVSNMAQGTGEGQRIGEKISPTSMSYRFQIGLRESSGEAFVLRTIVFMDRQQVTNPPTVPSVGNILEDARPQSYYTRELQPRFKIFSDKTMTMNKETNVQRVTRIGKGYVRFPRWLQTYFTGSGGTTLMRNHIYILQIASQYDGSSVSAAVPLATALMTIQVRFNYKDA